MIEVTVTRTRCRVLVRATASLSVALSYPALPLPGGAGGIAPPAIPAASVVRAPSFAPAGSAGVSPPLITAASAVFAPAISSGSGPVPVAPGRIESAAVVPAPVIAAAAAGVITLPTIAAASVVRAPTFAVAGVPVISPTTIAATSIMFAPSLVPAVVPITSVVHEGDSQSNSNPGVNDPSYFATLYGQNNPSLTLRNRAQPSRTVGGAAYAPEGPDTGTPAGNTVVDHRAEDLAYGPQIITLGPIGTNDLASFATQGYVNRLIAYKGGLGSVKLAWSGPPPFRSEPGGSRHPNYDDFTARRAALYATCRDPAVWGQWADIYWPLGEHPDYADPALNSIVFGDAVHFSGPASSPSTGSGIAYLSYSDMMDTLRDAARVSSTQMYSANWPTSETNLSTSTQIVRRFRVKGIAHGGVALTGANALTITGGGAQLRVNGGAWVTSYSGWLYNGDVIDFRITTSASNSTAVSTSLQVGTETRSLTFTTGAVAAPVTYAHGDVETHSVGGTAPTVHTFPARSFAAGKPIISTAAGAGCASIAVDGVSLTKRLTAVTGGYGAILLETWSAPADVAAGAKDIVVTLSNARAIVTISWGALVGADPVPTQVASDNTAAASASTGPVTCPANGLIYGVFGEYAGGASVTPATTTTGTFVDEGQGSFNGEIMGISVSKRTTTGALTWDFGYGQNPCAGLAFKAAGT